MVRSKRLARVAALSLTAALLHGCVSLIPMTSEQTCAARGMELDGVDIRSGSAITPGRYRMYVTDLSAVDVRCGRPRDALEKCKIDQYVRALPESEEFNATVSTKNLYLFFGYVAFVVPGIYLLYRYDGERDHVLQTVTEMTATGLHSCEKHAGDDAPPGGDANPQDKKSSGGKKSSGKNAGTNAEKLSSSAEDQ